MIVDALAGIVGPRMGLAGLRVKNHAPELYLLAGVAAGVATVIMAARAHKKSEEVFEDIKEDIQVVHEYIEDVEEGEDEVFEITNSERTKLLLPIYREALFRGIRLYGPPVLMGATAVALIMASHGVLRGRNRALLGTVAILERGFSTYRQRVIADQGAEADERYFFGAEERKVTTLEIDDKGKKKKRRSTKNHIPEEMSPMLYNRRFEEGNINWSPDSDMSEYFLRAIQQQMNDKFYINGYVLLNHVYKALGFAESPEGAVVGWSQKKKGDDYISFGLDNDINQREGSCQWELEFNVNGVVFDLIGE